MAPTPEQIRESVGRVSRYVDTADELGITSEVLNGTDDQDVRLFIRDLKILAGHITFQENNDPTASRARLVERAHALLTRLKFSFDVHDLMRVADFLGER